MNVNEVDAISRLTYAERANSWAHDNGIIIIPDGYKTENLERFTSAPKLFRGQFKTESIADFVKYINNNGDEGNGTAIYIDRENMTAKAILDKGCIEVPEWGAHTAHIAVKKSPEYVKLLRLESQTLSQTDLLDFIEDWEAHFYFYDSDGASIAINDAINNIRRTTVTSTSKTESAAGNFKAEKSFLEDIEITMSGGSTPPAAFMFSCIAHDFLNAKQLRCILRAITDGKTVSFKYRIVGLEKTQTELANEFAELLQREIEPEKCAEFYLGEMKYQ